MSRPANISDTLTLYPSGYTDNNSYMTISSADSAYKSSSGTSGYASLTLSSTSQGYVYFTFTVPTIPSGASITSVTCSVRLRSSSNNTVNNCSIQLYNNTTAQGSANSIGSLSNTSTVYNITSGGTWTLSNISNIRLRVAGQRRSSNTSGVIRVYGADLNIVYEILGTEYEVSISNTSSVNVQTDPSTTQYVFQGGNQEITITTSDINSISVTDNNVDVTSSLIQHSIPSSSDTLTFVPSGYTNETNTTNSGSYQYTNAYKAATTSGTYARWEVAANASFSIYYTFSITGIPSNATITSVQVEAALRYSYRSVSGSFTEDVQLYNGTTPMGEPLHFVTAGNSNADIAMTIRTISNTGSWTPQTLQNLRFVMSGSNGATDTRRIYLNGVTLTISYEVPPGGYYYTYTISNISTDHTIVIADKEGLYIKINGQFVKCTKIYKKINNVWTEVSLDTLTEPGIYIKK